jgi:hypothetical protein
VRSPSIHSILDKQDDENHFSSRSIKTCTLPCRLPPPHSAFLSAQTRRQADLDFVVFTRSETVQPPRAH